MSARDEGRGPQGHSGDKPGWDDSGRRRRGGLPAAVGVGVLAVLAGFALGRLGGWLPAEDGTGEDAAIPVTDEDATPEADEGSPFGEEEAADEGDATGEDDEAPATEDDGPEPVGSWREVGEAPITGRWGTLAVWTGREVLVWGGWSGRMGGRGGDALADGAVYDPDADAWRRMADAPRPALGWEETAVWTGEEMVVLGSDQPMAYDPGADAWRDLAGPPPGEWVWESAGWDGEKVVMASAGQDDRSAGGVVAYEPQADGWRALPDPPLADWDGASSAWLDGRMVLMGTTDGQEWGRSSLAVLDPEASQWSFPEAAPVGGRWLPRLVADPRGGRVLAAGGAESPDAVYEWSPQRAWRWLPDLSAAPLRDGSIAVATEAGLLAWEDEAPPVGFILRGDDEWVPVADPLPSARFGSVAVWTGEELVVWGGGRGLRREADGAALSLPAEQ